MKHRLILLGIIVSFAALSAFASSPPQSASITVNATNGGVFTFTIAAASYNFGTVDANGTANVGGTGSITGVRNGSNTGSTYTATTATNWTLASAPSRAVHIFNASTTSTINWGVANRLEVQIPTTGVPGSPATCGFLTFGTTGDGGAAACASGNLIRNFSAGNGASAVTGNLDFRLTVLDTDATGADTWTVTLTATSP